MGVSRIIFIQEALQKNFFFLLAFSIYWRHFPLSSVGKESACNAGDPGSIPGSICWRRDRLPTPVFLGFPCGSADKESACSVGALGSIPGLGRSPGEGIDYPLQYSWASLVAQLIKNLPAMGKTWVQSLGWEDPLERKRLPTPVFWPGECHGQRSLVGYSPWSCKKLNTTE